MFSPRKFSCLAVLAAAWLLSDAGSAKATFTLSISGVVVATDGGAGDTDSTAGHISYSATNYLGLGLNLRLSAESFYDSLAQEYVVTTNVLKIQNKSGSSRTLSVTSTEDSAFFPTGFGNPTTVVGSLALNGGVGKGTLKANNDSFIDGGLVLKDIGIGVTAFVSPVNIVDATMFNVKNNIDLTISAHGSKTQLVSKTEVFPSAVPAPAGLLLAATAMPVFGLFGWMKRRKAAVA